MSTEPWLTKAEIAADLKVSVRTVERYGLPAMRVGGQNRSAASGHFEAEQPGGGWARVILSAEDIDRLRAVPA